MNEVAYDRFSDTEEISGNVLTLKILRGTFPALRDIGREKYIRGLLAYLVKI